MSISPRWIAVFVCMAIHPAFAQSAAPPVAPPNWPVTSAPARFVINPESKTPPTRLSQVKLCSPDLTWLTMPIRVFNDQGVAVGSDLLWTAPGEPATLLFDSSSGSGQYKIYVGSNWPPLHLADAKAGVWLETHTGDGKIIGNLPDMLQAWKGSSTVLGRALVGGIDEGGNRFGPQDNLLIHMQGWFDVAAPEHLDLTTISFSSSFVLVDGKEVVEWPGHHEWGGMPNGQPIAGVDLAPGLHVLDYYNAYVASDGGRWPLMCSVAAKGGPFAQWTLLKRDGGFFRPVTPYVLSNYELQANSPGGSSAGIAPVLAMKWENAEQSVIFTDIPDIGLIALQLNCLASPPTGTLTWTFDDGTTAQGPSVKHLFARPGTHTVQLALVDGGKSVTSISQTISVHHDWAQPWKRPELRPEQEADIMGRDPATFSASDLVSCYAVFGNYLKTDDLLKLLPALCAKMKDVNEADLPYLKEPALLLVRDDWFHSAEEIQLLRALVDRASSVAQPKPATVNVASECRLALARLVLKTTDHTDEVSSLIAAINGPSLVREEPRVLNILKADLALAQGDVASARAQYEAVTGEPSGPDVRSSIRSMAKITQARAFLDRKDYDAAEDALRQVAMQFPIEKISPDWALTRLRLYQEENLPVEAFLWAKRLLPVINEGSRSELLFRLTELAFAQGDTNLAHKTLSELLKKHPYSQEAAQAKEKWPGQT